jgi:hypothetical protein
VGQLQPGLRVNTTPDRRGIARPSSMNGVGARLLFARLRAMTAPARLELLEASCYQPAVFTAICEPPCCRRLGIR